jgi:hypothetical protein
MTELRQIERDILAIGKVDGNELELLRKGVYTGGKINRHLHEGRSPVAICSCARAKRS